LRAALIAYAGVGVIFVDADLNAAERLVSVAHESGHFITDYLMVRSEVEASAPHLVDVLDGLRKPNEDDYIAAVLNRLPLGVHTHLLARNDLGEYSSAETERSEERATRVAWELLAPQASVEERVLGLGNPFELTSVLRREFGLPVAAARAYASFLRRLGDEGGHSGREFKLDR
jgi:Zn-dependent peptidase ImmA (M78 family)